MVACGRRISRVNGAMGSEGYHEPFDLLSTTTRELHRGLTSLTEELAAADWYQQRIDATNDPELRRILEHNRDEEKEHAAMLLEWIRRRDTGFARALRAYLFTRGDLLRIEEPAARAGAADGGDA